LARSKLFKIRKARGSKVKPAARGNLETKPVALKNPSCFPSVESTFAMIEKLKSGKFRLYSRKRSAATGKRRNLGTFASRAAAEQHERAVQFFKHHG